MTDEPSHEPTSERDPSEPEKDAPSARDEPERNAPEASPSSRPAFVPALAVAIALVVAGSYWFYSRHQSRVLAREVFDRASAFSACIARVRGAQPTLRDAVLFAFPRATPLALCQPELEALRAEHARLAALLLRRDRVGVAELERALDEVAKVSFAEPSSTLLRADLESLESAVQSASRSACRIAIAEAAIDVGGCAAPEPDVPAPPPPAARILVDETLGWLEDTTLALDTRGEGRLRILLVWRDRDHARLQARWLDSKNLGDAFDTRELELGAAEFGAPEPPRLAVDPTTGAVVRAVILQRKEKVGYSAGTVLDFSADGRPGESWSVPPVPEGLEPVRTGSPVLDVTAGKDRRPAVVLAASEPQAQGGALLVLESSRKTKKVATPPGRVLAAFGTSPPSVLIAEDAGSAGVAVVRYPLTDPSRPWKAAERTFLPPGVLGADPGPEESCGVEDEKYLPFVAHHERKSVLVALGPERLFALSFQEPAGSELALVCGSCPPGLLARTETELALLFPVGKVVAPMSVEAPCLLSETKAGRSTQGSCTGDVLTVAYVSNGRVIVQSSRAEKWAFYEPRVLAEPNAEGTPTAVWVAASGARTFVLWRRERDGRQRLRLELVASDDGGASWH